MEIEVEGCPEEGMKGDLFHCPLRHSQTHTSMFTGLTTQCNADPQEQQGGIYKEEFTHKYFFFIHLIAKLNF